MNGRIGNKYINNNWHFYLNWLGYKKALLENETVSSPFIIRLLNIPNTIDMVHGATYNVTLEDASGDIKLTSSDFVLEWINDSSPEVIPPGTITNTSGDITGVIDLSGITNQLSDINNSINDIPQKIYNDSGEKGIIQKVYDDLFTLDSGDVAEIYYNLEGKLTSGDTPLISFTAFLDILGQEPGDFIISWENIPINLTFSNGITLVSGDLISGDSINFSALAREVDSLATVKFWINTILSFSVLTILNFETYRIVLKGLGVATDLYNEADDEEKTTLTDTVTSGTVTNTTTGEVRDQNIRKTRTISHTRRL